MIGRFALPVLAASFCVVPPGCFGQDIVEEGAQTSEVAAERLPSLAGEAAPAETADAVSFEVGAGIEYDSNVAILEVDASTGVGDAAMLLEFGVAYDRPAEAKLDVGAGYDFSETMHEDFSAFDVRIHRGSANLAYDLGRFDVGASLQHAEASLDGTAFMELTQLSPFVSRLVGRRLFLRFAYTDADKAFDDSGARDATSSSFSGDAYVFVNGLNTYLILGYRYDDEDAGAAELDYSGRRIGVQLSKRLAAGAREFTLKTHLRTETRNYRSVTPSLGELRHDERLELAAMAEIPIGERVLAQVGIRRADNESNLPTVDFTETVVSVAFNATLRH